MPYAADDVDVSGDTAPVRDERLEGTRRHGAAAPGVPYVVGDDDDVEDAVPVRDEQFRKPGRHGSAAPGVPYVPGEADAPEGPARGEDDDVADAVPGEGGLVRDEAPGTGPGAWADDLADGFSERSVADVATSLWRLRNRLARSGNEERGVTRHLETAWDALADAGVEIQDHVNEPFDPGLSLNVVALQPTPGIRREVVIETIRPSVYLHDRTIQTGEVIVGTPVDSAGGAEGRP